MRYAFLVLMSVFAGIYAVIKERGSLGARLTVKAIASVSFVMIAYAGRFDAARPYYILILVGLCFSLVGDIFLVFQGTSVILGGVSFFLAHIGYIAAFFTYAPLSWVDAGVFMLLAAAAAIVIWRGKWDTAIPKPLLFGYATALCAMTVKAVSMLFAQGLSPVYAAFAALGGMLFAFSDVTLAIAHIRPEQRPASVLSTITYYAAQALLALSISL